MTPLVAHDPECRVGLASDACPICGKPRSGALQVNGVTVVDVFDGRLTERAKVKVVCVEKQGRSPEK
jgi:hypothetical protein